MYPDESLGPYREKRDFSRTPEPEGQSGEPPDENRFVVQKHDARNLHYDLRLEVNGVLKSWAVPKGPSFDPSDKRLAIPTEDHPLDYLDFEGVIPEGEYGAGATLVWDRGTYRNLMAEKDEPLTMTDSLEEGHVEIALEGEKLKGSWVLIRTGQNGNERWLLIKMKDEHADPETNLTESHPDSVLTHRSLDEIPHEHH